MIKRCPPQRRGRNWWWSLWVFTLLTGCAVGPDFVRPRSPAIDRYTDAEVPNEIASHSQAQHVTLGAPVAARWWQMFGSPALDTVVTEALANNPTVQAAQANLRKSQDLLQAGYGVFFPQSDGSFAATRQKFSSARFGQSTASRIFTLFTLSTSVNYALDIFGGERRAVESLQAQADVQQANLRATYLTLSGNIVTAMIAQAAYGAQIQATEEFIAIEQEQLRLTTLQQQAGTVPYATVLSVQSQLATTQATLPPLQQKRNQTAHLLATLVGRTPAEWQLPPVALADLTLPKELPVTLPSALVRRRPDILAAEAQLHSASAEIGVATAALFPSVTLNGTYGANNMVMTDLLNGTSGFWSLGTTLSAPLFRGGTLWFQRKAAIDGYQQSLASYRETVLGAFAQVADTLWALQHDAETVQAQADALKAAEGALRLIQTNYQAGLANYLQVLTADAQYHQAQLGYVQAVAQRLQDTVALFVALGGGWSPADELP